MSHMYLLEHEGTKLKLEVNRQTTPFSDFSNLVKNKASTDKDFVVEFFDKDFEEWILLDQEQFDKLPDKSKLRTVIKENAGTSSKSTATQVQNNNASTSEPKVDEPEDIGHIYCKYDIFVSHKQSTAKYLAQSIKHEVSQVVPIPLEWWIDVDRLDDLHDLAEFVKQSRNFLLLITPGVFESQWCLQEIRAALKYKKNIIMVIDEGVPFPKLDELPEDIHPIFKSTLAVTYFNQKQHREVSIKDIARKLKTRILMSGEKREGLGPDLALKKPTAASAMFPGNYKPENMVDGNEKTRWAGLPPTKSNWIWVDLGARYRLQHVYINFEVAYGKKFFLEVEDTTGEQLSNPPTSWKVFGDCRGQIGWNYYDVTECAEAVGRYLRIRLEEGNGGNEWAMSIFNTQVYGTPV